MPKSGTGRVWERKLLGFRLTRDKQIGIAPESVERFKTKVRELWAANQSRTSEELRDAWKSYVQGWIGCFGHAENRKPIFRLEGWIRRHIRKCFWLRWHDGDGRENALRRLGLKGRLLEVARSSRRSMEDGRQWHGPNGTLQRGSETSRLSHAIRSRGKAVMTPLGSTGGIL